MPQLSSSYQLNLGEAFCIKPPGTHRTKALLIGINYVGHEYGGAALGVPRLCVLQFFRSGPAASVLSVVQCGDETCCGGDQGHAVCERDMLFGVRGQTDKVISVSNPAASERDATPGAVVEDEVRCPRSGYSIDMLDSALEIGGEKSSRGGLVGSGV